MLVGPVGCRVDLLGRGQGHGGQGGGRAWGKGEFPLQRSSSTWCVMVPFLLGVLSTLRGVPTTFMINSGQLPAQLYLSCQVTI